MVIECLGFPLSFMLLDPRHVVRSDGSTIRTEPPQPIKKEVALMWSAARAPFLVAMLPFSFYSFFYISVYNKYLTQYFTVRARALSSLISPAFCIVGCFGLGFILDAQRWSQRTRAYAGAAVVFVSAAGLSVWPIIVQVQFNRHDPGTIDWTDSKWPKGTLPPLPHQCMPLSERPCRYLCPRRR